ncbi:hypothetical protein BS78_02G292000 [Paspalum vaginatum]|nr:hypothetical protein BS78_02G292000 [Paspalum vaginatum]
MQRWTRKSRSEAKTLPTPQPRSFAAAHIPARPLHAAPTTVTAPAGCIGTRPPDDALRRHLPLARSAARTGGRRHGHAQVLRDVRVRTRVGTACTGQALVFWLRAVVESAADDDGCLRVAYTYSDGKLPRVARVAPTDVKLYVPPADDRFAAAPTGSSSTVNGDHPSRSSSQQGKAASRATVAGKRLPKKLEKEMRKAIAECQSF